MTLQGSAPTQKCVHFRVCEYSYFDPGLEQEIALEDMRKKELSYTELDFDRIELEAERTLRWMMKAKSSPAILEKRLLKKNLSMRGLEERTPGRSREVLMAYMKGVHAVLALQELQKRGDQAIDEKVIAQRYRKIARPSVRDAHIRGLQDEVFAEWISEGCPEEPEDATNASTENQVIETQKPSKQELSLIHHRHSPSPLSTLFCGEGLGHFLQHRQLFKTINAS